jgi:hypothetical protein
MKKRFRLFEQTCRVRGGTTAQRRRIAGKKFFGKMEVVVPFLAESLVAWCDSIGALSTNPLQSFPARDTFSARGRVDER